MREYASSHSRRVWAALFALSLVVLGQARALAEPVPFGAHDARSAFYIAKSENQNQVHYGVRLDASCRPARKAPVFAYWKRFRDTGRIDAPLEGPGVFVYGASDEQGLAPTSSGARIDMYVKALDRLPIQIVVEKDGSSCKTTAFVMLNGERARLSHAFVQLGRLGWSISYVDVVGYRERDGAQTVQRFR